GDLCHLEHHPGPAVAGLRGGGAALRRNERLADGTLGQAGRAPDALDSAGRIDLAPDLLRQNLHALALSGALSQPGAELRQKATGLLLAPEGGDVGFGLLERSLSRSRHGYNVDPAVATVRESDSVAIEPDLALERRIQDALCIRPLDGGRAVRRLARAIRSRHLEERQLELRSDVLQRLAGEPAVVDLVIEAVQLRIGLVLRQLVA